MVSRTTSAMVIAAAAFAAAGGARAAEWTMTARILERFEADSNISLDPDGDAAAYGSVTEFGLDLTAAAPRTVWSLKTSLDGAVFGGPGATSSLTSIQPSVEGSVAYTGRRLTTGASFFASRSPATLEQFEDTGTTTIDSTQTSFGVGADGSYRLDPLNTVSFEAGLEFVRFDQSVADLVATNTYSFNATWSTPLSQRTTFELSSGVEYFTAEDIEKTQSLTWETLGRIERSSRRITAFAAAGATVSRVSSDDVVLGVPVRDSEIVFGFAGELGGTYRTKDLAVEMAIETGIEGGADGEVENVIDARVEAGWTLSEIASLDFSSSVSIRSPLSGQQGTGGDRQFATLSALYSRRVSPDWNFRTGYVLRGINRDGELAVSNMVLFELSREFRMRF